MARGPSDDSTRGGLLRARGATMTTPADSEPRMPVADAIAHVLRPKPLPRQAEFRESWLGPAANDNHVPLEDDA